MRHGIGLGLMCVVFLFGVIAAGAGLIGRTTNPSVKAVDTVYTARGAIDNTAAARALRIANDKAAADAEIAIGRARVEAAHAAEVTRLDLEFRQTTNDLWVVGAGVTLITFIALMVSLSWRVGGYARLHANTMAPNKRGQFAIRYDHKQRAFANPNMQSAPVLRLDDLSQLPAETQLQIYAWAQRANVANAMAGQKVLSTQVIKERQHVTNVLKLEGETPAQDLTITTPEPEFVPRGYIVDNGTTQEVQRT